jgi:hypothetical protein
MPRVTFRSRPLTNDGERAVWGWRACTKLRQDATRYKCSKHQAANEGYWEDEEDEEENGEEEEEDVREVSRGENLGEESAVQRSKFLDS